MKNDSTPSHVALLRGINVGGHKKVPMAELREVFGEMGFEQVRTVLATGNVLFYDPSDDQEALTEKIASGLEQHFGFFIPVLLRPFAHFEKIIETDPFGKAEIPGKPKQYATFVDDIPEHAPALPYSNSDGSFRILSAIDETLLSVLDLERIKTPDAMKILENMYGKGITTRTWKTVLKIEKAGR